MSEDDDPGNKRLQWFLVALLVVSIVGINMVNVADRTILQSDDTKTAFEDEDVYEQLTVEMQANVTQSLNGSVLDEQEAAHLVQESLTEEYVRSEVDRNIEDTYAFLNAERADVQFELEMEQVRESMKEEADEQVVRQEVNETIPVTVIIDDDVDSGPLGTARGATSQLPLLTGGLTLLALVLLGGLLYTVDSYRTVAVKTGSAIGIAGGVSLLLGVIGLVAFRFITFSTEVATDIDPKIIFDGITSAFESAIYSLLGQSALLLVIGVVLVGVGLADDNQLPIGTTTDAEADGEAEAEMEGESEEEAETEGDMEGEAEAEAETSKDENVDGADS